MSRIPQSFIDQVLAQTDIVDLIEPHVKLKKSGSNLSGLCPFHHEKTPSFSVSAQRQMFYCFGCGKGGGAFQFLIEHDGYNFPEAVAYLAERHGMILPQQDDYSPQKQAIYHHAHDLLARVNDVFVQALQSANAKKAQLYLQERGLPLHVQKTYELGYAPDGYGFLRQKFGSDSRRLAQLEAVGVLFRSDQGDYGDRFRDRLMFPIRNQQGKVVGFGGRTLSGHQAKYLNSPETDYFHKSQLLYAAFEHRDHIRKNKQVLLVEGYMDVLILAAHGIPTAVAPLGTATSETQLRMLLRLYPSPIFCFDGDTAGRKAAWRVLENILPLLQASHAPKFLYLPQGQDPDSMVRLEGRESFMKRLEEANSMIDTWLQGLAKMFARDAQGKALAARQAEQMLQQIPDLYLRKAWQIEVEKMVGIPLSQLQYTPKVESEKSESFPVHEEEFVAAFLQNKQRIDEIDALKKDIYLDNRTLFEIYTRALQEKVDYQHLIFHLTDTYPSLIARWLAKPIGEQRFVELKLGIQINSIRRLLGQQGEHRTLDMQVQLRKKLQQLIVKQRGHHGK
ncbi:MAG: DNA primase [Mariprofundaceae bacterium]|nr:DNA primase [Mariprofundaceae bacterium]